MVIYLKLDVSNKLLGLVLVWYDFFLLDSILRYWPQLYRQIAIWYFKVFDCLIAEYLWRLICWEIVWGCWLILVLEGRHVDEIMRWHIILLLWVVHVPPLLLRLNFLLMHICESPWLLSCLFGSIDRHHFDIVFHLCASERW